jgi:hypothetical protein
MNGKNESEKISDLLFELFTLVCQTEHLQNGCKGDKILHEINSYLKYNSNSTTQMERFRPLLERGRNR